MIAGIGTDLVEISRLEAVIERQGERFVQRILTDEEQVQYHALTHPARFLAKRFAAKEAVAKAFGTGIGRGVSWQDITIFNDENGAPKARLTGGALDRLHLIGAHNCHLSISDEQRYATAFVVLD